MTTKIKLLPVSIGANYRAGMRNLPGNRNPSLIPNQLVTAGSLDGPENKIKEKSKKRQFIGATWTQDAPVLRSGINGHYNKYEININFN